jgi:parallel beta-helix repeat protein
MSRTLQSAMSTQTKSVRLRRVPFVNPISRLLMAASLVAAVGVSVFTVASQPAFGIPNILTVSTTGSDTGTCLITPCHTLGYALSQALGGDTIVIDAGTYLESHNPAGTHNTVGAALSPLTIKSASGNASNTIIDATGELNGIVVNANDVTIEGLTVENSGAEGILITPPSSATPPSSIVGATITSNVVSNDDQCIFTPKASFCPPPQPEDDYGESVHLESVANSTVSHNAVEHNVGGILLTDEVGPTHGNLISDNTVSDNTFDCGITLAGHSNKAVALGGPDFGQPQPSQAGVYDNMITGNVADGNGAAGLLAAAATVGATTPSLATPRPETGSQECRSTCMPHFQT